MLSETNTTNDVTEQLDSLQRSLGDARAERTGLLRQLVAAPAPSRQKRCARACAPSKRRSPNSQASLGSLTGNVDYTTISLTLTGERAAGQRRRRAT